MTRTALGSELVTRLNEVFGLPATLRRGARETELTVLPGNRSSELELTDGTILTGTFTDFSILASAYVINSQITEPQEHDRITAGGELWAVLSTEVEKPARHHTPYGDTWRVHAKKVPR